MRTSEACDGPAADEHAGERQQPDPHRHERDELEQRECDESCGEDDHPGREQRDAEDGRAPEAAAAPWQREGADDDREEGQAQAARDDVVHHRAHRDRDETDGREVQPRRDHRAAERACRTASGLRRKCDGEEHAVRREEEPREHDGRVERAGREVGERAQLREVVVPPQRVLRGERRDGHAQRQRQHGEAADAVREGVVRGHRAGLCRAGRRDARGRGDMGDGVHGERICWCFRCVGEGRGRHATHDRFCGAPAGTGPPPTGPDTGARQYDNNRFPQSAASR